MDNYRFLLDDLLFSGRIAKNHFKESSLMVFTYIFLILLSTAQNVQVSALFPNEFNAALNKPLELTPADATCELGGPATYCESSTDPGYRDYCNEKICTSSCPHGATHPVNQRIIESATGWDQCVFDDSSSSRTSQPNIRTAHFKGGATPGQNCYLTIDPANLAAIRLQGRWDISYSVWLKPKNHGSQGTLLDVQGSANDRLLRLYIETNSQLVVELENNQGYTNKNWSIPQDTWVHLAVQVHDPFVAVLINGEFVYPALFNIPFSKPRTVSSYRFGLSHEGDAQYLGLMEDAKVYFESLSNREVMEIYNGTLPETRINTECRCPSSHPALNVNDEAFCVANQGPGRDSTARRRLNQESHITEFLNDGKASTFWISEIGISDVKITIDLLDTFQVLGVDIEFYSPLPETVIIERKFNATSPWRSWQYFTQDCRSKFNMDYDEPLIAANDVSCRKLYTSNDPPYSQGVLTFDILANRPGKKGSYLSETLREFMQASHVRVTLNGQPHVKTLKHQYHGVREIRVRARCDCNGHASGCDTKEIPYKCACDPTTNTKGRNCEVCDRDTFRNVTDIDYLTETCQSCDCFTGGISATGPCLEYGGQCPCKTFAGGRRCDTCKKGYYDLQSSNPEGCKACTCNVTGTLNNEVVCDPVTARCVCKSNVRGFYCDQCKEDHYGFDAGKQDGCTPCNCNADGVVKGKTSCDATTGQCECKALVTGRRCDTCKDSSYNLQATEELGCVPCNCDPYGAVNSSCDPVTGQCFCKDHVTGSRCDVCEDGYYAGSEQNLQEKECTKSCDCHLPGTEEGKACDPITGKCNCKENVVGRRCDQCKADTYKLEAANPLGCTLCNCTGAGTVNSSTQCDLQNGVCPCKANVVGLKCNSCKLYMFGLSKDNPNGCDLCDCHKDGATSPTCDVISGQCDCRTTGGNATLTDRRCVPYVTSWLPWYGPVSGGTLITMEGGYLGTIIRGRGDVGPLACVINKQESNDTTLQCLTESARKRNMVAVMENRSHAISVTFPDGFHLEVGRFEYRPDPIIQHISPMSTFLKGGRALTVKGKFLTSVFAPVMEVSMVHKGEMTVFSSACEVKSPSLMVCPTPEIYLPANIVNRRRRDTREFSAASHPRHRTTRQVAEEEQTPDVGVIQKKLNNEALNFYLGFKLDGVQAYRNLSKTMPQFGVLNVYSDPILHRFEEEGHVRLYKTYSPYNHDHIVIKGDKLNLAASKEDFNITVGVETCDEIDLATNQLACRPPDQQPEAESDIQSKDGSPEVTVRVGNIVAVVGYLKYENSWWDNPAFRYGIIGAIAVVVLLVLLILILCLVYSRRKQEKSKHPHLELHTSSHANAYISAYYAGSTGSTYLTPVTDVLEVLQDELRLRVQDCLIDSKRMVVGKVIGKGHFGRVHIGRLVDDSFSTQGRAVAIKTIRDNQITVKEMELFLAEATIMKDFKHSNVLHLVGVAIENNRAFVLLPYMQNGDLKNFIQNEENMLTVGELIHFGLQIADGMCYLAEQKFVHRDLAARNCMVDKDLIVKIADFGLSRDIYQTDYYQQNSTGCPLPVKWMAIENLDKGVFSSKSDVWSYGVLLWELMTRGCTPYPDVDPFDIRDYLKCGHRMDKPDFAPPEMYVLMLNCWDMDPNMRPTFVEIHDQLCSFLEGQNSLTTSKSDYVRPRSGYSEWAQG